ncbi:hypothetical protein KEM52_006445 [Ascosphaera acerosa]|nr:hypothetical protein KEM52_006445 [Ascosphaera acerosa]
MAPIRRYLRISRRSVLECRIYLSHPGDERWLGSRPSSSSSSSSPPPPRTVIEQIFAAIRPLVLPKLREENARRAEGKAKKSAPVKDVLVEDEFEVALFLREAGTRHSLLTRQKRFIQEEKRGRGSMAGSGSGDAPVEVPDEETSDVEVDLDSIPLASDIGDDGDAGRRPTTAVAAREQTDDKKLAAQTTYEGFCIWGWVLCLLVTRRNRGGSHRARIASASTSQATRERGDGRPDTDRATGPSEGQMLMEEWISTQALPELVDEQAL